MSFKRIIYDNSPSMLKKYLLKLNYNLFVYKIFFKSLKNKLTNRMSLPGKFKNEDILYVNPDKIIYTALNYKKEDIYSIIGVVRDGDWDLDKVKVEEIPIYCAIINHFTRRVPFCELDIFRPDISNAAEKEKNDAGLWDSICSYEYDTRLQKIENLYEAIKRNGYQSQKELGTANPYDEIKIKIGRDGQLLFVDGIHRLAIAKILNIKSIPLLVTIRHKKWVIFKKELFKHADSESTEYHKGELYQKLNHPDLQNIPHTYGEERFNIIKKHLRNSCGDVLDIGANLGYFCSAFEELGYKCYAVEYNKANIYFMRKLRNIDDENYQIIYGDILDPSTLKKNNYNIVLALNIFHHFIKSKEDFYRLSRFLKDITMEEMFFEPHNMEDLQMQNAYKNFSEIEFIKFILNNSCLKYFKRIDDESFEGRKLYQLYR